MSEKKGTIRRGICLYSYHNLLGKTMTLEDAFEEMYDTGATCFDTRSRVPVTFRITRIRPRSGWINTGDCVRNIICSPPSWGTGRKIICTAARV